MLSTGAVLRRREANSDDFIEKPRAIEEHHALVGLPAITGRPYAVLPRSHEGVP